MAQSSTFIDYYQLLGISSDSSTDQIKKAYKKLALKKHPDRNPNNHNAGDEFATLVEAKEILTNTKSRNKYNGEYNIYKQRSEQRQRDVIHNAKMSEIRKSQISKLENAEKAFQTQNRKKFYEKYTYDSKKNSVKEELAKFKKLIEEQQRNELNEKNREWNQKIDNLKQLREEEKLKKRSLIVKLDRKKCVKPYNESQLNKIFKIYGKIMDIHIHTSEKAFGAEIIFAKSKSVWKALKDEQILSEDFCLILIGIDENRKKKVHKINAEQQWRQFVKNREYLSHKQYETIVANKVKDFVNKHGKCDNNVKIQSDNDTHTMDVD